ncbi:Pre-mRNA-splicing factor SPP2 [Yarrowia sp. C11]|nr:Pre-mRNA-splicing factor SPP2 [Yarrowia sp. E02]KAG5372311.1 Pre-mRNA-splicing factor SPP2 [Yarrowia sp. C11]
MISFNLKGNKAETRPKKEQRPEKTHGSLFEVEKETSNVKQVSEFAAGELPEKERLRLEEEARLREEKAKAKKIIYLEEKNWRQDLVERREAELTQEEENPPKKEEGEEWKPQFGLSVFASRGGEIQEQRELQALRQDINALPDMASVEDYASMPVEDFGAALFRGMESALPQRVATQAAKVPEKRPALLGLGAKTLEEHLPEELGTWGKASRPKPEYTPVVMRNVRTGEIVDEKQMEKEKEREKDGSRDRAREGSYDSRGDRDSRGSESSRRSRDRERSPHRSSRREGDRRGDDRDRHRRSRRDDDRSSRRDDDRRRRDRGSDRDRDRRDRDDRDHRDRDRDRDRRDRRDRERDGDRRDRDRDQDRDRRR